MLLGSDLIYLIIGVGAFYFFFRSRSGGGSFTANLFLLQYDIDEKNPTVIQIKGRRRGLIQRILGFLNIGAEFSMVVTRESVSLETSGLFGTRHTIIPINRLAVVESGYAKPFMSLVFGIVIALAGVFYLLSSGSGIVAIIGILVGGYLIWSYWRSRAIELKVASGEGFYGFSFFEAAMGLQIDVNKVYRTTTIMNKLIIAANITEPYGDNMAASA